MDADGEFPAIGHGVGGGDAGGAFDDGRVDTAVDHAPRRAVVLTEFGVPLSSGFHSLEKRRRPAAQSQSAQRPSGGMMSHEARRAMAATSWSTSAILSRSQEDRFVANSLDAASTGA